MGCIRIPPGTLSAQGDEGSPIVLTRMDVPIGLVGQPIAAYCNRDRSLVVQHTNEVSLAIALEFGSKAANSLFL
jgi:hypothetical protein